MSTTPAQLASAVSMALSEEASCGKTAAQTCTGDRVVARCASSIVMNHWHNSGQAQVIRGSLMAGRS